MAQLRVSNERQRKIATAAEFTLREPNVQPRNDGKENHCGYAPHVIARAKPEAIFCPLAFCTLPFDFCLSASICGDLWGGFFVGVGGGEILRLRLRMTEGFLFVFFVPLWLDSAVLPFALCLLTSAYLCSSVVFILPSSCSYCLGGRLSVSVFRYTGIDNSVRFGILSSLNRKTKRSSFERQKS